MGCNHLQPFNDKYPKLHSPIDNPGGNNFVTDERHGWKNQKNTGVSSTDQNSLKFGKMCPKNHKITKSNLDFSRVSLIKARQRFHNSLKVKFFNIGESPPIDVNNIAHNHLQPFDDVYPKLHSPIDNPAGIDL